MCNPITSITTYCFSGKRRKIKYSNVLSEFEDIHGERVLEGNFNKKDVLDKNVKIIKTNRAVSYTHLTLPTKA